jgi:hypothetical protein
MRMIEETLKKGMEYLPKGSIGQVLSRKTLTWTDPPAGDENHEEEPCPICDDKPLGSLG